MRSIQELQALIEKEIAGLHYGQDPKELYDPIDYIMALGGKRMRPLLSAMTYQIFKDDVEEVIRPILGVEVFHNFTLMHDDIMDKAPLRRGNPTVHKKWNDNIAILSGDVMLVKVYEILMELAPHYYAPVLRAFNDCATGVCEGQQIDMNFESKDQVTEEEYIEMIRLKTAVLLGFCMELGGILGEADSNELEALRKFGEYIGIGFQLKDDLLDVYADNEAFGKQKGGDIISNKKTYLVIKALEIAGSDQLSELNSWMTLKDFDPAEKVDAVTTIFDQLEIAGHTHDKMSHYFDLGFAELARVRRNERTQILEEFARSLINRDR